MTTSTQTRPTWTIDRLPAATRHATTQELVAEGLARPQKALPPLLLYDARGSELFEQICDLDEYYVTRTERLLLDRHATELAKRLDDDAAVGELGSGSSEKTTVLLDAILERRDALDYYPVDISEAALVDAAERLSAAYPRLRVHAVVAEYREGARRLAELYDGQHFTLFLGSNLGNFDPVDARDFLAAVRAPMGPRDVFLMGVDLVKDRGILERAYDDAKGVTAAFDMNLLVRLNRELGADFDLDAFEHRAVFDAERSRVEMRLVSKKRQTVRVAALERSFDFEDGEHIHTESSYKYTPERLDALCAEAGWRVERRFVDDDHLFSLNLLTPTTKEE